MSLKKVSQVKADKGFRIWDLIIYGAIAVIVAVLFIVIFTTRNTDPLTGVKISVKSQVVFQYSFSGQLEKLSDCVEVKEDVKGITITVKTENEGINELYIDKNKKSVKMVKANCRGKDCIHFPTMTDNGKYIFCSPHGVKVEPLFRDLNNPDIIM